MSWKTSVIIPYYQEEPGILRGAVASALSQEGVADLEIIVVDDGSPAPARDDLKDLELPAHVTLKLIEQPNRGPGAARNRGLDAVSPDTAYIAFLDSDDRWTPNHLGNAHAALEAGHDFYFADVRSSDIFSQFDETGLDANDHVGVDPHRRLWRFRGNLVLDLLSGRNHCRTSTVVYRKAKFDAFRFIEFTWMGEDHSFCMSLAAGSAAVAFCCDVEALIGRGVNIYGSSGWDSPTSIWRHHQYMKWRKWLSSKSTLSEEEKDVNQAQIRRLRRSFVTCCMHEIRVGRAFTNLNILKFIREDPAVLLSMPTIVFGILVAYCSGRLTKAQS